MYCCKRGHFKTSLSRWVPMCCLWKIKIVLPNSVSWDRHAVGQRVTGFATPTPIAVPLSLTVAYLHTVLIISNNNITGLSDTQLLPAIITVYKTIFTTNRRVFSIRCRRRDIRHSLPAISPRHRGIVPEITTTILLRVPRARHPQINLTHLLHCTG